MKPLTLFSIAFAVLLSSAFAQTTTTNAPVGSTIVGLRWDQNSESNLAGYNLYFGEQSQRYTHKVVVPLSAGAPTASVTLTNGTRWHFAVTAFNVAGLESAPSNEIAVDLPDLGARPSPPGGLALASSVTTLTSITTVSNTIVVPYRP